MPEWTPPQREAIGSRGTDLLLSAGAGSGKTAVLTERIVSMALDGTPLRRMLIVTFTNAAALEMRQRIQSRLEVLAREATDGERRARAREQLEAFAQANISTIHSFCQKVLRRHFQEAGIDPAFRVGDEYECAMYRQEALDEILEDAYRRQEEEGGALPALEAALCDGAEPIERLLLRCYQTMMSLPAPWQWLDEAVAAYGESLEEFWTGTLYQEHLKQGVQGLREGLAYAMATREIARASSEGPTAKFMDAAECCVEQFQTALRVLESDVSAFAAVSKVSFPSFASWNKAKGEGREQAQAANDAAKEAWKKYGGRVYDAKALWLPLHGMHAPLQELARLLREFHVRYGEKKRAKGLVDFADLEHMALDVLRQPAIRAEYRQRFDGVFVDEYQDSNRVQEELMEAVGGEGKCFYVGDVKQSIYRFRAADPSLFSERAERYDADEKAGRRIDLRENFRSVPNILHGVNDVFLRVMALSGELPYGEEEKLIPGREKRPNEAPLSLFVVQGGRGDAENIDESDDAASGLAEREEMTGIHREAVLAARLIRQRIGQPIYDPQIKTERPTRHQDIAILLRTAHNQAEAVARALAEEGIPAYAAMAGGYFEALEVQVLLNLMRLVDNRRQDIALLSVMRAGICGFTDAELVALRSNYPKKECPALADAFLAAARSNADDPLHQCCRALNALLLEAKQRARALRLDKWIEWLLGETGYDLMTAALPGGRQRSANLEVLLKRARDYESIAAGGLYGFLQYVDRVIASGRDMGEAVLTGEGSDAVRIMTVHASKGLQFPIVMLLGLGKEINQADQRRKLLLHRDAGLGARGFDAERRIKSPTLRHEAIVARLASESVAEELRLLYVAMTRACEELILMGSLGRRAQNSKKYALWMEGTANSSLLDFLLDAVIRFPEAEELRTAWDIASPEQRLPVGKWKIQLVSEKMWREDVVTREHEEALRRWEEDAQRVESSDVAEHYAWRYPAQRVPGKVTVSALASGRLRFDETPKFLARSHRTGADVGKAYHAVLEKLDWSAGVDRAGLGAQVTAMLDRELLTSEQADMVDLDKLAQFTTGSLGQRMKKAATAGKLRREWPFTILLDAGRLPGADEQLAGEETILQGIIDACFVEDDHWVLVDYKSDRIVDDSPDALHNAASAHQKQLSLYADALEQLTHRPVQQAYVFLLAVGQAVPLELVREY